MNHWIRSISIITVVYNGSGSLASTIESVVRQKEMHPLKYAIIDGQSTDGTVAVIQQHSQFVDYWVSEPDRGIYDAMNKGWAWADADSYVLFLGAGDQLISLPQLSHYPHQEVVYGKVMLDNGRVFNATADFRLRLGNTLHHQALLVPKSLHPSPPFDLQYKVLADFDFNQRLLKAGCRFVFDEHLVASALPGGVSQVFNRRESLAVVRKNFGWWYQAGAGVYYSLQQLRDEGKKHLSRFS